MQKTSDVFQQDADSCFVSEVSLSQTSDEPESNVLPQMCRLPPVVEKNAQKKSGTHHENTVISSVDFYVHP